MNTANRSFLGECGIVYGEFDGRREKRVLIKVIGK
jgi:hypothetical protein